MLGDEGDAGRRFSGGAAAAAPGALSDQWNGAHAHPITGALPA